MGHSTLMLFRGQLWTILTSLVFIYYDRTKKNKKQEHIKIILNILNEIFQRYFIINCHLDIPNYSMHNMLKSLIALFNYFPRPSCFGDRWVATQPSPLLGNKECSIPLSMGCLAKVMTFFFWVYHKVNWIILFTIILK